MARRSTPQHKTDDLAFPVRLKFAVPPDGLWRIDRRLRDWLARELPPGEDRRPRWAWHAALSIGTQATALYFRSVADAHRFVEAFPEFELADGTKAPGYTRPGLV
jgi:hypothetical protein